MRTSTSPCAGILSAAGLALLLALLPRPAAAQCTAAADYGAASLTNSQLSGDPSTALFASGDLNTDVDTLLVEMYANSSAFPGDVGTGTFILSGENYDACGLCVRLLTEVGDSGYLATGGSVTISQVTPQVVLSVSNLTLQHVVIDPNTFTSSPHPDGCTSAIASATLDTTPAAAVPSLAPAGLALLCSALLAGAIRRPRGRR